MKEQIITGIVSGLVVAISLWLVKIARDIKDTKAIINFLRKSKEATEYSFRSNHAIASNTHLSEERVRKLCSKSRKKIKRNEKEKESWNLIE